MTAQEIVEEVATVDPIYGHEGVIEGYKCRICNRPIAGKWWRWLRCCPDGDCLGAKARRFLDAPIPTPRPCATLGPPGKR